MEEAALWPSLRELQNGFALLSQVPDQTMLDPVEDLLQAARAEAQEIDQPVAGDGGPLVRPDVAAAAAVILRSARSGGVAHATHPSLRSPFG